MIPDLARIVANFCGRCYYFFPARNEGYLANEERKAIVNEPPEVLVIGIDPPTGTGTPQDVLAIATCLYRPGREIAVRVILNDV